MSLTDSTIRTAEGKTLLKYASYRLKKPTVWRPTPLKNVVYLNP